MKNDRRQGRPGLFTEAQVREWRRQHAARKALPTLVAMARKAGVTTNTMRSIIRGDWYKWVRP